MLELAANLICYNAELENWVHPTAQLSNFTSKIVAKCLEWSWSYHVASQISGKSSPSFHADMPLLLERTALCHNAHLSTPEKLDSAYSTFNWCYLYGNWKKNCGVCGDCVPLRLQTAVPCLNTDFSVCITIRAFSDIVTCEYYLCYVFTVLIASLAFLLPVTSPFTYITLNSSTLGCL